MKDQYCFWSVADGEYVPMMERTIASARAVGVFKDFHVWSDRDVAGARTHRMPQLDPRYGMFKIRLLREQAQRIDADYLVWLDADSWFVRHPGDPLRALERSPVHVPFLSDLVKARKPQGRYQRCGFAKMIDVVRHRGVVSPAIFTTNGGFWIVKRDAVDHFAALATDFWVYCHKKGYGRFREEPALAFAAQMLCGDPLRHTLRCHPELWSVDLDGLFARRLPTGKAWRYRDPITGERFPVNPAIIHLPHAKALLAGRAPVAVRIETASSRAA